MRVYIGGKRREGREWEDIGGKWVGYTNRINAP